MASFEASCRRELAPVVPSQSCFFAGVSIHLLMLSLYIKPVLGVIIGRAITLIFHKAHTVLVVSAALYLKPLISEAIKGIDLPIAPALLAID